MSGGAPIVWPPSLPARPRREGYSESLKPDVVESPFEVGEPKRRPRTTGVRRSVDASIVLDTAQKAVLLGFFERELAQGCRWFVWPDYADGVAATLRIDSITVQPLGRLHLAQLTMTWKV